MSAVETRASSSKETFTGRVEDRLAVRRACTMQTKRGHVVLWQIFALRNERRPGTNVMPGLAQPARVRIRSCASNDISDRRAWTVVDQPAS
ncbi:hypothetical protein PoB_000132300 [Plakobranchus ocellatus]|uniref:Uncharacterized protein n=1 Tax=Plakobranchus ocellatus TaxID=259542 RepID=A0AAV3XX39_9GAST|nr:hypothetical protein PoB_000132300 [Plakobranchus ocellatus]